MAIGDVIFWPSDNLPEFSLVLDGSELAISLYPQLYTVYQRIYTPSTVDEQHFCLPDYRGCILRGVDSGTGRDEYATSRTYPGDSSDAVGTYQGHRTKSHLHAVPGGAKGSVAGSLAMSSNGVSSAGHQTSATGGAETRCDNIALTFITFYQ